MNRHVKFSYLVLYFLYKQKEIEWKTKMNIAKS